LAKKKTSKKKAVTKKKTVTKKTTKKKVVKKAATKKKVVKKAAKKSAKKTAAKSTPKKSSSKAAPKKPSAKKTTKKAAAKSKPASKAPVKSVKPVEEDVDAPLTFPAPDTADLVRYAMSEDLPVEKLKKLKNPLHKKEIQEYFKLLLEKRAELVGDYSAMEKARSLSAGEISNMPLHMADVGSDNFDQEFTLGLMESERRIIKEIEDALQRCTEGTYGICLKTGRPIPSARLEAKPWAKYTIEVARERERMGILH